jgi:sRNA-binding protein
MMQAMRLRVIALAALISACGPIAYVGQVTLRADDAVEAARAAEADKYSPYWWTRAKEYLYMAREVAGHADYQGANHFGRLAEEAAIKAKAEAEAHPRVEPAKVEVAPANKPDAIAPAKDPKTDIAPAKDTP